MSSRAHRLALGALVGALVGALAVSSAAPTLSAQSDVAALRRQYEALRARQAAMGEVFDSIRRAETSPYTDSLVAGGRRVRFVAGQLNARDRAVLIGALDQAATDLAIQFGEQSPVLSDTASWSLQPRRGRSIRRYLRLELGGQRQMFAFQHFALPLDSAEVASVARTVATRALPSLHPWLTQYLRSGYELDSAWTGFAWAGRNIATSGSSVGRRCLAGSVPDCRAVLDVTVLGSDLQRFYTTDDWPDLSRRLGKPREVPDSAWTAAQDACAERADAEACRRIFAWQQPATPFREDVRTTLVVQALLMGRGPGLDRVLAARGDFQHNPIGFFADLAGVSEDSLIAAWRTRIEAAARSQQARPMVPVFFTTLAWGGLLLLVTTRRRLL